MLPVIKRLAIFAIILSFERQSLLRGQNHLDMHAWLQYI